MVDPNQLINVVIIVLMAYIAIILLSNVSTVAPCSVVANSTLKNACNTIFNNAGVLFLLFGVLILLLVIPMIQGVIRQRRQ